jgi:carboxymethylenebutenolidase
MCHGDWQSVEVVERSSTVSISVGGGQEMPGNRFLPEGTPRGNCVVLPDIFGVSPFYREISRRLANEGFATTLLDYFFREEPLSEGTREAAFARRAGMDEERALLDLNAAIEQVAQGGRLGLIGFCLSGQFVLDLCATRSDLAAVAFYPFPEGVAGPVRVPAPRPIDLTDRMSGPIISFWGTQDYIPLEVIERFGRAMSTSCADYTARLYRGATHGFLLGLLTEDEANSAAARDAWLSTIEFLGTHVGRDEPGPAEQQ